MFRFPDSICVKLIGAARDGVFRKQVKLLERHAVSALSNLQGHPKAVSPFLTISHYDNDCSWQKLSMLGSVIASTWVETNEWRSARSQRLIYHDNDCSWQELSMLGSVIAFTWGRTNECATTAMFILHSKLRVLGSPEALGARICVRKEPLRLSGACTMQEASRKRFWTGGPHLPIFFHSRFPASLSIWLQRRCRAKASRCFSKRSS